MGSMGIGLSSGEQAHVALLSAGGRLVSRPSPVSTYEAGEEIFAPGEKASRVYKVEYGAVRLHKLLSDGRRQIIGFHFAGEIFGLEAGLHRTLFAEAIVPTALTPTSLAARDGGRADVLELALHALMRAQNQLVVVGRQSAIERMAGFLLNVAERQGNGSCVDLPMPRIDIADYLGLTIETVSRAFAKLRSAGMIRLRSIRCIEFRDIEELRLLCS